MPRYGYVSETQSPEHTVSGPMPHVLLLRSCDPLATLLLPSLLLRSCYALSMLLLRSCYALATLSTLLL